MIFNKQLILCLLTGMYSGLLLGMNEPKTETPEEIRDRALKSGFMNRVTRSLETYEEYYKKDVFNNPAERTNPGIIADGILAGCDIDPMIENQIDRKLIEEVCYYLAIYIRNEVDKERAMHFVTAMVMAHKVTALDIQTYLVTHQQSHNVELINNFNNIVRSQFPTGTQNQKRSWKEWCQATQSIFAKKTICALVISATALAAAAKLTYSHWLSKKSSPDITEPLSISIENKTDTSISLILDHPDEKITIEKQNAKDITVNLSSITIAFEDKAIKNMPVDLSWYQKNRMSSKLHIVIEKAPVWKRWIYRILYHYTISWQ